MGGRWRRIGNLMLTLSILTSLRAIFFTILSSSVSKNFLIATTWPVSWGKEECSLWRYALTVVSWHMYNVWTHTGMTTYHMHTYKLLNYRWPCVYISWPYHTSPLLASPNSHTSPWLPVGMQKVLKSKSGWKRIWALQGCFLNGDYYSTPAYSLEGAMYNVVY